MIHNISDDILCHIYHILQSIGIIYMIQFVSELNQGPCIWQYICHQNLVVPGSIVHLHSCDIILLPDKHVE